MKRPIILVAALWLAMAPAGASPAQEDGPDLETRIERLLTELQGEDALAGGALSALLSELQEAEGALFMGDEGRGLERLSEQESAALEAELAQIEAALAEIEGEWALVHGELGAELAFAEAEWQMEIARAELESQRAMADLVEAHLELMTHRHRFERTLEEARLEASLASHEAEIGVEEAALALAAAEDRLALAEDQGDEDSMAAARAQVEDAGAMLEDRLRELQGLHRALEQHLGEVEREMARGFAELEEAEAELARAEEEIHEAMAIRQEEMEGESHRAHREAEVALQEREGMAMRLRERAHEIRRRLAGGRRGAPSRLGPAMDFGPEELAAVEDWLESAPDFLAPHVEAMRRMLHGAQPGRSEHGIAPGRFDRLPPVMGFGQGMGMRMGPGAGRGFGPGAECERHGDDGRMVIVCEFEGQGRHGNEMMRIGPGMGQAMPFGPGQMHMRMLRQGTDGHGGPEGWACEHEEGEVECSWEGAGEFPGPPGEGEWDCEEELEDGEVEIECSLEGVMGMAMHGGHGNGPMGHQGVEGHQGFGAPECERHEEEGRVEIVCELESMGHGTEMRMMGPGMEGMHMRGMPGMQGMRGMPFGGGSGPMGRTRVLRLPGGRMAIILGGQGFGQFGQPHSGPCHDPRDMVMMTPWGEQFDPEVHLRHEEWSDEGWEDDGEEDADGGGPRMGAGSGFPL